MATKSKCWTVANDGTGDTLRDGAIKLNSVIDELYTNLEMIPTYKLISEHLSMIKCYMDWHCVYRITLGFSKCRP